LSPKEEKPGSFFCRRRLPLVGEGEEEGFVQSGYFFLGDATALGRGPKKRREGKPSSSPGELLRGKREKITRFQ